MYDPSERSAAELEAVARAAEAAALAVPGVARSEGGSASTASSRWRLVTSEGFDGAYAASGFSLSAAVIAEQDGAMERGGEGRTTRWLADLPAPEGIGAEAGRRAVAKLGPRKIASTTAPVIFDNRMAGQVISPLLGAISGPAIARGTSFLMKKMGQQVLPKGVSLIDDPAGTSP